MESCVWARMLLTLVSSGRLLSVALYAVLACMFIEFTLCFLCSPLFFCIDSGGVKLAYVGFQAFMKERGRPEDIDGFTPEQRFFLAWATIWRNNIRKEMALQRLVIDPHSPGMHRANGPLSVLPEFHEAFNVKPGDKMYVPEQERCEIW
jgi:Peptidase family M13